MSITISGLTRTPKVSFNFEHYQGFFVQDGELYLKADEGTIVSIQPDEEASYVTEYNEDYPFEEDNPRPVSVQIIVE